MGKIKKICNFLFKKSSNARIAYTKYYEKTKIQENEALFQSYEGSSISGNVFYLLKEMCTRKEYDNFTKYVVSEKKKIKTVKQLSVASSVGTQTVGL